MLVTHMHTQKRSRRDPIARICVRTVGHSYNLRVKEKYERERERERERIAWRWGGTELRSESGLA